MYLKEIKAVGFKSFADKMRIELNTGISGVVGPNGSGKSNVVDAVRWVLGEQSVKQLRGEGAMSDVIFSGSKSRKPASVASVTLIFDNSDKALPIDYTEVSIKRSIYRSGENEYYLNNEKCRLKDVQELLADSGASRESFNIISQGDIASILSNKPEERRIIFEAAAGTLKYKKRKDEALRKLERTHNNMARINDVILELKNNIEPLENQSKAAKKYLDNKKKLDELEVSLIVSEIDEINYSYQIDKNNASVLNSEIVRLESENNLDNSKIEALRLEKLKHEEEFYSLQSLYAKAISEKESLLGKKNLLLERQKYDSNDAKVHESIVSLKESILKKENEISSSLNSIRTISDKISEINSKLKLEENEYNKLKNRHDENEKQLLIQNRLENETSYKIDMIRNSIENNSGLPYAVKNVLDNPKLVGVHDVIANLIETDKEYSTAISTALGAAANYIVVEDEFTAKEAINYLKINKFGRATFFPLNIIKSKEIDNVTYQMLSNNPDFIGTASSLVRYESTYDSIIKNQLGTTIVVKDIDIANDIARKINYRYRIVTLDGELLHVGGSLTGGMIKNSTNLITQKHELNDNLRLLDELQVKRANLEREINDCDNDYKLVSEKRQKLIDEVNSLKISLSFEQNKNNILNQEKDNISAEINNLKSVINKTLNNEEERIINDYYSKEKEVNDIKSKISYLKEKISSLNEDISNLESGVKFGNQDFYKKSNELKELEIKINRADVKLDNLLSILSEDYAITYEKAKKEHFLDMNKEEARKIVDKCKLEIKKLGDVNIGAIDEYDRVRERYDFLNTQKEDLIKAQDTILEIIKELDSAMKHKFIDTFDVVKEKFKEVFKQLFGGGNAELSLTNPNDVLTTGIEIKALPPGKKLQHLSLLSGGEKTLTAISLLFAILKTRPVPFCILDEVEAALDEVNVDNFGKFLNEYKNQTQFIVITHKKKTMEYADVLYGITMQESGVSKLVSVKLEDINK